MTNHARAAACTIVSNNYLAFARVFADSYREHNPEAEVVVCVTDRPDPGIPYSQMPFEVVFAEELGIPKFANFAFRYDILELNTAVKPFFLAYLRDRLGLQKAFYFDADILVLDSLHDLETLLAEHDIVLTPHITGPIDDGYRPGERELRQCGVYNLGFLGLRLDDATRAFLRWWQERLYRFCVARPQEGLFVDQSWMDFAPAFLERVAIVRDPRHNVAYWNLAHRAPVWTGRRWQIGGEPVGFFHFSGVRPAELELVSVHQNRVRLARRPELRPLFEDYRDRLLAAGYERLRTARYGFGYFEGTDIPIPATARKTLHAVDPLGRRWADPFDPRGSDSYFNWLIEPLALEGGRLNRAALGLWEQRPDLRQAFPDIARGDLPAFVRWLRWTSRAGRSGVAAHLLAGLGGRRTVGRRRAEGKALAVPPMDAAGDGSAPPDAGLLRRPGRFARWLNEPIDEGDGGSGARVTRLALRLHHCRPDVSELFPEPLGKDRADFAYWFVTHGAREFELHPSLVRPVLRSLPPRSRLGVRRWRLVGLLHGSREGARRGRPERAEPAAARVLERRDHLPGEAPERPIGVNVAGYFGMDSGVAQIARGSLAALAAAGIASTRVPLGPHETKGALPEGMPHPVTLVHANADEVTRVLQGLPLSGRVSSCLIGYWFWEIAHFPLAFADRFRYLDEVWAPSRFCQRAFETLATVPVRYVPPCVTAPQERRPDRRRFGMEPDRFYFFFAFDVLSVSGRKNPWGVIEVVRRLRRRAERPVGLVLKVANGRLAPDVLGRIAETAGNLSMVLLLDPMRREEMEALLASCDACLSLHRSEGLGLLPIECMYLGKPVIATGYGGITDFLDEETGFPVRYTLRPLERAEGPYPQGAAWAEPDISQAVELAARVLADPAEAARRAETARRRVSELFGVAAASRRFAAEVARVALAYDPARSRERVRGGSRRQEPTDPANVTGPYHSRPGYPGQEP